MTLFEFGLPELGEGLHEGRISKWLVQPGDTIQEDDAIAEVENDKSLVELPSPVSGKIVEIKVAEGTTCVVGDIILTIEVAGDVQASHGAGGGTESSSAPADAPTPAAQSSASAIVPAPEAVPAKNAAADVLATPVVRRYAREQGVDIASLHGTGTNGKAPRRILIASRKERQRLQLSRRAQRALTQRRPRRLRRSAGKRSKSA